MIGAAGALDGEYRKTTLPNGIRLVTEWIPHVRSVAVGVSLAAYAGIDSGRIPWTPTVASNKFARQ